MRRFNRCRKNRADANVNSEEQALLSCFRTFVLGVSVYGMALTDSRLAGKRLESSRICEVLRGGMGGAGVAL
jgi:hypothetical protein